MASLAQMERELTIERTQDSRDDSGINHPQGYRQ